MRTCCADASHGVERARGAHSAESLSSLRRRLSASENQLPFQGIGLRESSRGVQAVDQVSVRRGLWLPEVKTEALIPWYTAYIRRLFTTSGHMSVSVLQTRKWRKWEARNWIDIHSEQTFVEMRYGPFDTPVSALETFTGGGGSAVQSSLLSSK